MPDRIGWIGFHVEGALALEGVLESGRNVVGMLTLDDEGLRRRSGAFDYRPMCRHFSVPLYRIGNVNDEDTVALLRSWDLDLLFVIGWSQILGPTALAVARMGAVGTHASMLPKGRGRAPVNWAIIKGWTSSGNTLFWLDPEVDAGRIIDQRPFEISLRDTCATVYEKVAQTNRDMILDFLRRLDQGSVQGSIQDNIEEDLLPGRRPKDGRIDWNQSAVDVYNLIRGVTHPYPGAFTFVDGEKYMVWSAALLPDLDLSAPPGSIVDMCVSPQRDGCGPIVACGSGALILNWIEGPAAPKGRGVDLIDDGWKGRRFK